MHRREKKKKKKKEEEEEMHQFCARRGECVVSRLKTSLVLGAGVHFGRTPGVMTGDQ
jgi:hypothetical protein